MTIRTDFQGRSIDLEKFRQRATVSDRALVQYIRDVLGMPVDQFRAQILSDAVLQAMALKAPSVQAADHQVVLSQFDPLCVAAVRAVPKRIRRPRRRKTGWQTMQEPR